MPRAVYSAPGSVVPIMRSQPRAFQPPKIHEKRRGVRLNSRVPVAIEWEDGAEQKFRQQALTRIIGPYGCLIVLPNDLAVEQCLRVVNLATQQSLPGTVVWKGHERAEGWEFGIELEQPPLDFWGVDL